MSFLVDGIPFDRTQGIGGSDAPIIAGLSPFMAPVQLWEQKRGNSIDREPSFRMRAGQVLEDGVRQLYTEVTGRRVHRVKRTLWAKLDYPAYAHLDGRLIGAEGRVGYEGKLSQFGQGWEDGVPDHYQVQVQHYLLVTGWDAFEVAVLIGGAELRTYRVARDEAAIGALRIAEAMFWKLVVDGTPPEPDGHPGTADYLNRKHPEDDGTEIVATPDATFLLADVLDASDAVKSAETALEAAKNRLRAYMGDATAIVAPGVRVTWKAEAGKPSWKAIAEDYRRLIEAQDALQLRGLPDVPKGVALEPVPAWLDFIESMHVGQPGRTMRITRKKVAE